MNKTLLFILVSLTGFNLFSQTLSNGYPSSGIVGYWSMDANANDVSGNNNNGVVNGAMATTDRFGIANGAYLFNGTSDFIEIPDNNLLDLTNSFTLSGWFSTNSTTQMDQTILGKGRNANGTGYMLITNAGPTLIGCGLNNTAENVFTSTDYTPYNAGWHHVVATYDGTDVKLYVDNVLVSQLPTSISLFNSDQSLYIGRELLNLPRFFNGKLDDVAIWNRPLTTTEINTVYNVANGAALNFDGTGDFVAIASPTNIPIGNASYTIEAKIKTSVFGSRGIVGWGNYGQANQVNAFRLDASGQLVNYWWANDLVADPSPINLADGEWHHVVTSYDGTTRSIYVDGVLKASDTPGVNTIPNASNMRIGSTCPNPCGGEFYNGGMDEVRIWNRALPQAEIINNMNCELAAGQTGLVAYYQFNQGVDSANNSTVTTLTDASGNGNNGTLTNFTLNGTTSNWIADAGVTTGNTCPTYLSSALFQESNFSYYPNPTTGIVNLKHSEEITEVSVLNLLGQTVLSQKGNNLEMQLDLSKLAPSTYLVKVISEGQSKTVKIIKQ